jgi:hypothetical protein
MDNASQSYNLQSMLHPRSRGLACMAALPPIAQGNMIHSAGTVRIGSAENKRSQAGSPPRRLCRLDTMILARIERITKHSRRRIRLHKRFAALTAQDKRCLAHTAASRLAMGKNDPARNLAPSHCRPDKTSLIRIGRWSRDLNRNCLQDNLALPYFRQDKTNHSRME